MHKCARCGFVGFLKYEKCTDCGMHKDRSVKRKFNSRRHRPGKRGRNSGKVGTAKNK